MLRRPLAKVNVRLENRNAWEPRKMRVGSDKLHLIRDGRCVNDRVGHGQLMTDAEFSGSKRDLAVQINNFAIEGFADKFICNRLAPPEKKNLSHLKNDNGGYDDAPLDLKIGRKQNGFFIGRQVFEPAR